MVFFSIKMEAPHLVFVAVVLAIVYGRSLTALLTNHLNNNYCRINAIPIKAHRSFYDNKRKRFGCVNISITYLLPLFLRTSCRTCFMEPQHYSQGLVNLFLYAGVSL